METISWIHLSDLHLTQDFLETIKKNMILNALFLDIQNRKKVDARLENVNFVFITGDLVQAGIGYDDFYENVVRRLLLASSLRTNQVFVVPGNHDCIRSKIDISDVPITDETKVSQILNDKSALSKYLLRQEEYISFIKKYFDHIELIDDCYYKYEISLYNLNIVIFGINSSWCAGIDSQNKTILGIDQIYKLKTGIDISKSIIISLIHHDLNSFQDFENNTSIESLKRISKFILHGHKHKLDSSFSDFSSTMFIAAGTIDSKNTIGYNYVIIDLNTQKHETIHRIFNHNTLSFETANIPYAFPFSEDFKIIIDKELQVENSIPINLFNQKSQNKELKDLTKNNLKILLYLIKKLQSNLNKYKYKDALLNLDGMINISPNSAELYHFKADTYEKLAIEEKNDDYLNKAIQEYTKGINLNKECGEYYYLRGKIFLKLKINDQAMKDLEDAITYNYKEAKVYALLGVMNAMNYLLEDAEKNFSDVINIDPSFQSIFYFRGLTRYQMKSDRAEGDFTIAINLEPMNIQAYFLRGQFRYYKKKFSEAKSDYDNAIRLEPNNAIYHMNRGRVYLVLDRINEGLEDCDKAIGLNDKLPVAYLNRSIAYLLLDNKVESRNDYEKARQLANEQNDEDAIKEIYKCFDKDGNLRQDWNVPKRD